MARLAEIIRTHQGEILQLWADEAGKAAAARGLSNPELVNLIASYLPALADAGEDLGTYRGRPRELVEGHLASRLRQGFQLSEIVDELHVLGRCICTVWSSADGATDEAEIERLRTELHLATAAVAAMFTRHMLDDEQTDKRYRRLLHAIAVEALQPGAPPFEQRLRDVLQLVMEATGTQTVGLLLSDVRTRELHMVAAVGLADEALERYVASTGPESFAGQVAANKEPTAILDASATDLEVSDTLRRSGIHSLLGIRLPTSGALLGVMYVGLTDTRKFSAREMRRLEWLGEQLSVQIENAGLHTRLREQVDALQVERDLRERFVAVLAHDLRGPLSAARLTAERLMRDPESTGPQAALPARIARSLERADRMIRDLLDANRIRAGERLPLQITQFDLAALAREVVEELSASYGDRFEVVTDEPVIGFWSADELRRSVWNLATNAVKYGADAAPITTRVHRLNGRVQISVHNFGPSISADDQERLFDPFARTRTAQAGAQRGWGLGLTLVRGCAEAHGGRTMVASGASGTTFTVELPVDARPFQSLASGSLETA